MDIDTDKDMGMDLEINTDRVDIDMDMDMDIDMDMDMDLEINTDTDKNVTTVYQAVVLWGQRKWKVHSLGFRWDFLLVVRGALKAHLCPCWI